METNPPTAPNPPIAPSALDATLALANAMGRLSVWIFTLLDDQPAHPEAERLRNLERHLDDKVNELTGAAIKLLGEETDEAVKQLSAVSAEAASFAKKVDDAKHAIQVAVSLIGLAGALIVGDAHGVLTSAKTVKKAVDSKPGKAGKP